MHKDAKKIARRIDDAFAALREQGFFAKANHTCCQSCGLAEIPEDGRYDEYVFYHMQDAERLKDDGVCYLAWGFSGPTLETKRKGRWICSAPARRAWKSIGTAASTLESKSPDWRQRQAMGRDHRSDQRRQGCLLRQSRKRSVKRETTPIGRTTLSMCKR